MTGASLIFVLEMLLKVVDCGIVLHHGAYLHDPWNVLDSFIVLISVVSVTGAGDLPASALKAPGAATLRDWWIFRFYKTMKRGTRQRGTGPHPTRTRAHRLLSVSESGMLNNRSTYT